MPPLIVGAGPVGLGAAVFLRQAGVDTRIIDMAHQPSNHSRALAVNPRTLELLESSSVTAKMLAIGLRIRGVRFRLDGNRTRGFSLGSLRHKYPFMLALSQAATERLLTKALEAAGGSVERGTELMMCRNDGEGVEAELKHATGSREMVRCPWLLAADGAHSTARKALNLAFNGGGFEQPWYLADVPLATSLEAENVHLFFPNGKGFIFLIRVVDETTERTPGPKLWRVISDLPNPIERLPEATPAGAPVWSSEFHISHRMTEHMRCGRIYFAGDAAHLHSPMGARGMNLGLEDAWVFSQLVKSNRLEHYESLRKRCDYTVVKRVEFLSRVVLGESFWLRSARTIFLTTIAKAPFVRNKFLTAVTGLDHALELDQQKTAAAPEAARRRFAHRHAH